MDATNSDDKKNIFAALNDAALFSEDELALLNNNVYSLEPFDSAEIDGILNSYNYGSSHETNSAVFPPSWNDAEIENSSDDFLNGGIDYGNLLSSYIDNTSNPINPANDLLSLDLLHEQPYELILPYEPEPDHQTETDENDIIEFGWDEYMMHSPKSSGNIHPPITTSDSKSAVVRDIDTTAVELPTPGRLGELQQQLMTKFESLKYDEVHQYEFSVEDKEAPVPDSLPKTMDNLRQYHVFIMPMDSQTDYEASMHSLREKFRKNPLVVGSLVGQSLDPGKQSKLIIPFKPKLVDFSIDQKERDDPNVVQNDLNDATKVKRSRKQPVKLTEPLKTRHEISDVLEALRNAAETQPIHDAIADQNDEAAYARPPNERKGPKEKSPPKSKKIQEQKVTNSRCSERIQQRRRKSRVQAITKRHELEKHTACDSAKPNHRSTEPNC